MRREADRNAQEPAWLGAGAEIAGQDSRGCQPQTIAAQEGSGAARACACACPWQPIETAPGLPVLVSRPSDSRYFYTPTTAYRDATHVWRLFRSSPGGMQRLPFAPTHWMPLPEPVASPRKIPAAPGGWDERVVTGESRPRRKLSGLCAREYADAWQERAERAETLLREVLAENVWVSAPLLAKIREALS